MRYFKANFVHYTEENVPTRTGYVHLMSERDLIDTPTYMIKTYLLKNSPNVKEWMDLYGYESIRDVEEILESDLYDEFAEETGGSDETAFKNWVKEMVVEINLEDPSETIYLEDITGTIGAWLDMDFDEEIPKKVINLLAEAYNLCAAKYER